MAIIIGIPIKNAILPAIIKDTNAPILEEKLKILEVAEARNRLNLLIKNNAIIKILPVPGPIKQVIKIDYAEFLISSS